MEKFMSYAEEHPWLVGALTLGAVFILLWLLGFFGSSSSSSSTSSGTNLAAAYYAAEAAQTTAGTQLQMATEYYTNQTAQDQIQANAATGIAATQANMYTTLGSQNAGTTVALGSDQLLATENNSNDALAASNTAASFDYQTAVSANNAGVLNNFLTSVVPAEIAAGGSTQLASLPGIGTFQLAPSWGATNINTLESMGYSPQGAAQIAGVPYPAGVA